MQTVEKTALQEIGAKEPPGRAATDFEETGLLAFPIALCGPPLGIVEEFLEVLLNGAVRVVIQWIAQRRSGWLDVEIGMHPAIGIATVRFVEQADDFVGRPAGVPNRLAQNDVLPANVVALGVRPLDQ